MKKIFLALSLVICCIPYDCHAMRKMFDAKNIYNIFKHSQKRNGTGLPGFHYHNEKTDSPRRLGAQECIQFIDNFNHEIEQKRMTQAQRARMAQAFKDDQLLGFFETILFYGPLAPGLWFSYKQYAQNKITDKSRIKKTNQ